MVFSWVIKTRYPYKSDLKRRVNKLHAAYKLYVVIKWARQDSDIIPLGGSALGVQMVVFGPPVITRHALLGDQDASKIPMYSLVV